MVVNSIPIITLLNVDKINLLKELYEIIYIPCGVFEEFNFGSKTKSVANIFENNDFAKVVEILNKGAKPFFPVNLHKGKVSRAVTHMIVLFFNLSLLQFFIYSVAASRTVLLDIRKFKWDEDIL